MAWSHLAPTISYYLKFIAKFTTKENLFYIIYLTFI